MATAKQVSILYTGIMDRSRKCLFVFQVLVFLLLSLESDALKKKDCTSVFPSCHCNDIDVKCVDEKHLTNITDLYPYIGDHVKHVSIKGSNFRVFPTNFLGSCKGASELVLNELLSLELPNNNIQTIHGKSFHCMPNLTTLDLSNNGWKNDLHTWQTGYFTSLPKLKNLYLVDAFDDVWNGTIHIVKLAAIFNETDMTNLEILRLSKNEFYSFSEAAANTFCRLKNLLFLDMSHNKLDVPSFSTQPDCLKKLEILNFSNNQIEILPKKFMEKLDSMESLKNVFLGNNTYRCDGDLLATWNWLNTTKVPIQDKQDIRCGSRSYDPSYVGKLVLSLAPSDLKYHVVEQPSGAAAKVVFGIIFAVIGCAVVGFMIYHRKSLGHAMKRWKKRLPRINLRPYSGYSSVQEVSTVENM